MTVILSVGYRNKYRFVFSLLSLFVSLWVHTAVVSASSSLKSLPLSSLHISHCIGKTGCPPSSSKHNKSVSPLLSPAPPLCSDAQLHVGCQPFDTTIDRRFPLHSQNEHTPALITYFSSKLVCLCVCVSYCVCSESLNHSSLCLLFLDSQMSIVGGNMHKLPKGITGRAHCVYMRSSYGVMVVLQFMDE